ncbi:SURF1-like protein [Rhynchospora pubera]|uniref:SURF1-like protein n=1 Tax=Rhynchospora pubera TaxID=906938 RepID=A0AAV8FTN2_9POAL|nr:SURF1-like protein [Rhynchospora pubera]
MVAAFSKALQLRHTSRHLHSRLAAFSTSHASPTSSTSSSLPPSTPSPSQTQGNERGAFSKLLLFLPGAITFGLGTWQLFRRQEKIEMLDYRRQRLGMEPLTCISSNNTASSESLEFRRIVCEGDFDEKKSVFVGPRSRSISGVTENGYYVITPLIPRKTAANGVQTPVLVNRGWVPRGWRDKVMSGEEDLEKASTSSVGSNTEDEKTASWWNIWSKKPTSPKAKEAVAPPPVKVVGVIRGSEKPSMFVPPNDPDSGQWFFVDVPMIARTCGLPENSIYLEEIEDEHTTNARNPYPVPKDINTLIRYSVMPQDHLNYTATWYTLSAAVTFMAVKRIKAKKIRL